MIRRITEALGRALDALLDVIEDDRLMGIIVAILSFATLAYVSFHSFWWFYNWLLG